MRKILAGAGAVIATTAGKVPVATAVAAASIGGAQAAEIVDIAEIVPGKAPPVVTVTDRPVVAVEVGNDGGARMPDSPQTHGSQVSDLARNLEAQRCEFGQTVAETASVNASDHRQNPDRDHPGCVGPDEPGRPDAAGRPDDPGRAADGTGKPDDPGKSTDRPEPEAPGRPNGPGRPDSAHNPEHPTGVAGSKLVLIILVTVGSPP